MTPAARGRSRRRAAPGAPSAAVSRRRLARALKLLERESGRPLRRRHGSAVDVLVGTILSQNTSGANSSAGFAELKRRFGRWSAAADARAGAIERCIRSCGLSRVKAPRIRRILRQVRKARGRISLEFLRRRPPEQAYDVLLRFDGVGPKTALCVMMFSLGMDVFPVDTHVGRVTRRLDVLGADVPLAKAHEVLAPLIPPGDRYALHLLLIAHGRRTCRAQRPRCAECVLLRLCPHGKRVVGGM